MVTFRKEVIRITTINELQKMLDINGLHGVSASKLMKTVGQIDINKAHKIVEDLKKASSIMNKFGKTFSVFDSMVCPETFILFIDRNFEYIIEKYKPHGLSIPFINYDQAKKWLIDESLKGVLSIPRIESPKINGVELWKADQNVHSASLVYLGYEKWKDGYNSVICNSSPFLLELRDIIESLKLYTGFDSISLLKYFLCGIKPKLERVLLTKTTDVNAVYRIQLNTNDITREEFIELYELYRIDNERKYKRRLSDKMKSFSVFIEGKEIPDHPDRQFYLSLMEEWNKAYPEWKVTSWQAMKKKHTNLIDKNIELTPFLKSLLKNKKAEEERNAKEEVKR